MPMRALDSDNLLPTRLRVSDPSVPRRRSSRSERERVSQRRGPRRAVGGEQNVFVSASNGLSASGSKPITVFRYTTA